MKIAIALVVAVAMTGLTTAAVSAAPVAPTKVVAFGDLDLTSAAGMKTLTSRINNAASVVCEPTHTSELADRYASRACRTQAINAAMTTVTAQIASRNQYASR